MAVTVLVGLFKTGLALSGNAVRSRPPAGGAPRLDRRSRDRAHRSPSAAQGLRRPDRGLRRPRRDPRDAARPRAAARGTAGGLHLGGRRRGRLLGAQGRRPPEPAARAGRFTRRRPSISPSPGRASPSSAGCRSRGSTCRSRCRSRSRRSWAASTTPRARPPRATSTTRARSSRPRASAPSRRDSAAASSRARPTSAIPAYKKMGAGAGYAVATGLFVGLGGIFGYLPLLVDWIPAAAVAPILIYIGIEVLAQAFTATPSRHAAAAAIAAPVPRIRRGPRGEGGPAAGRRGARRGDRRDAPRADAPRERLRDHGRSSGAPRPPT